MSTAAEQGGQGFKVASHPAGVRGEIPPPSHKPGTQTGSPYPFPGRALLGEGGRRVGSSAAHVSQCEPKCGSLRGFDAGDV